MSTSSTSVTTTTLALAPSIPQVQIKFLNSDGTVSLPWYRFLQSLTANQGAARSSVTDVVTTISSVTTTVSAISSVANEALALAESFEALGFLAASGDGIMTGAIDLGPNAGPVDPFAFINQVVDPRPRNTPRPKSPDIMRLAVPTLDQPPVKVSNTAGLISNHLKSLTFGTGTTATSDVAGNVAVTASGGGGGSSSGWPDGPYTPPPAASTWTQVNFAAGITTLIDVAVPVSSIRLADAINNIGNNNQLRMAILPIPGVNWTCTARLRRSALTASYMSYGVTLYDSASQNCIVFGIDSEAQGIGRNRLNNPSNYSGHDDYGSSGQYLRDFWVKLKYDGINCYFSISDDGIYFAQVQQWASTAKWGFLSNAATHAGIGYNANNAGNGQSTSDISLLSWNFTSP